MAELLGGGVAQDTILRAATQFRDRQISRMPLVGCTEANAPLIEEVYRRVLDAFTKFRSELPYLFGTRPSLGDFGLFGALFTCRNDRSEEHTSELKSLLRISHAVSCLKKHTTR